MPPIKKPTPRTVDDMLLEVWEGYRDEAKWKRSRKGNLWREWGGMTITIFKRGAGYRWCIVDGDEEPRYAGCMYETEDDAISGAGDAAGA